jgi:hypothetical protein
LTTTSVLFASCYANIKRFACIRKFLTKESTAVLSSAMFASKLAYCNSLFSGMIAVNNISLQLLQNSLIIVIKRLPRRAHITSYLSCLHWFSIQAHIDFKLALLSRRALHTNQPMYFSQLLTLRSEEHTSILQSWHTVPQTCHFAW